MAKLSRSAFISMLGGTGVFLLTGCGSGTKKNSNYSGVYRSAYTIPQLGESGYFNFTVDVKGRLQGSFDNQNGKVREFTGELKNNGEFTGTATDRSASASGFISGKMASSGGTAVVEGTPTAITGGNFTMVENDKNVTGDFLVGGTPAATGTSNYQGFYNGIYNIPELNQNGLTSFSVDSSGNMTGSLTRKDETGLLTGTINSTGNFTASIAFRNETSTFTGTLIKTTDNSTLGSFTQTVGGKTYAGSFGKTTVETGQSPYAGSYRGTYGMPGFGETGGVSLTVDPSGAFTGFFNKNDNSPVGTITGAFNNNGLFTGTVTYDKSTGIADRPITGKLGQTTVGGGGLAGDFVMTISTTVNGVTLPVNQPGNMELIIGATELDSEFRASYTSAGRFPDAFFVANAPAGTLNNSDSVEFSVDKQGTVVGTWGDYTVTGIIGNDSRISGTVTGIGGTRYAFEGIVNKVQWKFGNETTPGIKGDMTFVINGSKYAGYIKATGGDGTTG